ncbi:Transketolase, central region [Magnetococcus marinus MC-1]|uniref:Transketolase, central region n=1 Tax=Magnetococcus marinus (strain ATCC BAA-1437 / JCM 17883 / MC-1) TaxID=156889 RepID=A0L592_MAGMM|nr:transketolase C-terminal domain-containing protein [Magnetococcus marinus]ABK43135.1 Transketolase, central region [Magnetococcus marinus MC-1]
MSGIKTMRDAMIARILDLMATDERLFFLSADMGAPLLDTLRESYPKRFINVGIAEQNLINVAAGLAMEGCCVYTLAIAPFYLRAFEQIRNNLSIAARFNPLNVNMMGIGGGVSYDISGPSHHALEDLATLRSLPDVAVISPADWLAASQLPDFAQTAPYPKYIRLDGKGHEPVTTQPMVWRQGFQTLQQGARAALLTTGFMTQKGQKLVAELGEADIGHIDLFQFTRDLDEQALAQTLRGYGRLVTLHEGYLGRGGLDTLIDTLCRQHGLSMPVTHLGFPLAHQFLFAPREHLHAACGMGIEDVKTALLA